MTTERDNYHNAQPAKPRQPRQHRSRLTVQYRLVRAPDGLERLSKVYNILLQRSSGLSGKQLEATNKGEGDANTMSGQGEDELETHSATHEAEQLPGDKDSRPEKIADQSDGEKDESKSG